MIFDTVVLGSGMVGLCCARQLQRQGLPVAIVDRDPDGFNASCGNAGGFAATEVLPLDFPDVLRNLPGWLLDPLGPVRFGIGHALTMVPWLTMMMRSGRAQVQDANAATLANLLSMANPDFIRLFRELDISAQLHQRGALWCYETKDGFEAGFEGRRRRRELGIIMEELSGHEARRLEPALGPRTVAAAFTPQWMHVDDPAMVIAALRRDVVAGGAAMLKGDASGIKGDRLVLADGPSIPFRRLVVAAGAWSGRFARDCGDRILLESERGYNRTIPSPGVTVSRELIFPERHFVATPMSCGLRIGGASEFRGLTVAPDYRRSAALAKLAGLYLPELVANRGTDWMGHRPATPDGLPVIGRSPRRRDVYYAFGHGHLGFSLAPVTSRIIADLIAEKSPALDLQPLSISRFDKRSFA